MSLRQILFAKKSKTFAKKNLTSKREIVNSNSHGRRLLPSQHDWIGEANIQLGAQQMQAQIGQAFALGQFHHQQIHLKEIQEDIQVQEEVEELVQQVEM